MSAGPISTAAFLALVVSLVVFFSLMARRVAGPAGLRTALLLQGAMLAVSLALASSGLLRQFDRKPPPMLLLVLLLTVLVIVLSRSRAGALLATMPLPLLVGFQAFRLPVELVLHAWYREGVLPVQMTYAGRNADIVTGLLAIPLALALRRGRVPPAFLWIFNVLGLALLLNIVGIAVASFPGPLRVFMNEPANRLVAEPPYVWLPTYLVQAALFGHLLLFRRLRSSATAASPGVAGT